MLLSLGVSRTDLFFNANFLLGVGAALVATILAFSVPWMQVPERLVMVVPLLDFVAIGLYHDSTVNETSSLSLLCFFPAVWLALLFDMHGVLLATVSTALVSTVPTLLRLRGALDLFIVVRQLLLPLVILLATTMLVISRFKYRTQRRKLIEQAYELHLSLAAAERNARLLDHIINSLAVGIVAVDAAGNDLIRNRTQDSFHALASPPANEDKTEAGHHLYHRDGITPLAPTARPVYRAVQGETFAGVIMNIGAPGTAQRVVSAAAQPMVDENGEREGAVIVFSDITDMAEIARNREVFVSAVSHELRTPITSIVGYLDLVRDDPQPHSAETNAYLEVIDRNAEQVLRIIDDLLTSAQVANGSLKLKKVPADLATLVQTSVDSATPRASVRHVELRADIAEVLKCAADPIRIAQVLDNLISNAIKYTPQGGDVTVRTFGDAQAHTATIQVQDSGVGMSHRDLSKLFTPYFRTEAAVNSAVPGVGLGLMISKQIIEGHDGSLSVDSTLGVGTTFSLSLPCIG